VLLHKLDAEPCQGIPTQDQGRARPLERGVGCKVTVLGTVVGHIHWQATPKAQIRAFLWQHRVMQDLGTFTRIAASRKRLSIDVVRTSMYIQCVYKRRA
jgi:hypothetical protein